MAHRVLERRGEHQVTAGEVLWTETYTRDATWAGAAKPYRYGLRHRFPKPVGLAA